MEKSGQFHDPPALPPRKEQRYPPDRGLGEPQSLSGRGGDEKKTPVSARNPTQVVQPVA
jgi:hypothetical protein